MTDYKTAHLAFIKRTSTFQPTYVCAYYTYYETMSALYSGQSGNHISQEYARKLYEYDLMTHNANIQTHNEVVHKVKSPDIISTWFVTINFDHETWEIKYCVKVIKSILAMEWVLNAKANFELHTEKGDHPHFHILLLTKEPKSNICYKLYRPLYVKKVVKAKNFIDVKIAEERHHKYINLDKKPEKLPFVEKDKEWRKKNDIPDFEKNWKEIL